MTTHVSREIAIEWDGQTYYFTPSNRLLRHIDSGLAPQTLLGTISIMDGTNLPLPAISYIVSEMVQAGGGHADEDAVLQALLEDMDSNDARGILALLGSIGEALATTSGAAKNQAAPEKAGAPKGKKLRK